MQVTLCLPRQCKISQKGDFQVLCSTRKKRDTKIGQTLTEKGEN